MVRRQPELFADARIEQVEVFVIAVAERLDRDDDGRNRHAAARQHGPLKRRAAPHLVVADARMSYCNWYDPDIFALHSVDSLSVLIWLFGLAPKLAPGACSHVCENEAMACHLCEKRLLAATSKLLNVASSAESLTRVVPWNAAPRSDVGYS